MEDDKTEINLLAAKVKESLCDIETWKKSSLLQLQLPWPSKTSQFQEAHTKEKLSKVVFSLKDRANEGNIRINWIKLVKILFQNVNREVTISHKQNSYKTDWTPSPK